MSSIQLKRTPKNFRYLLSLKEIKELEQQNNLKFKSITNGHISNSGHFKKENHIQSSIRGLSIHCYKEENGWEFSYHQSGFRSELLPPEFELQMKEEVKHGLKSYFSKINNSIETDGLKSPQLWLHIMIIDNKLKCNFNEIK